MPFSIRPYRRFPVLCVVTYNAGPLFKLPLAYFSGFGSAHCVRCATCQYRWAIQARIILLDSRTHCAQCDGVRYEAPL